MVAGALLPGLAGARVLQVGPTRDLAVPSAAARIARDGDVVEIDAGTYVGDVAIWRANDLTLRGVGGGYAHLRAAGRAAQGKAIWVISGRNTTVEHIEFSGARVRDRNGAGIRQQGAGLVVRDCYFHDNEEGILASPNRESDILVERSEFAHNGYRNGQAHNIYIGRIRSFTLRGSYVHDAVIGSNVKSRARLNRIEYNRIMDGADGRGNYDIDLSNGGRAYIIGNVIQQGPHTENYHLIAFAPEGAGNYPQELFVVHNTMVNDRIAGGRFVWNHSPGPAYVYNNLFVGAGKVLRGEAVLAGNVAAIELGWRAKLERLVLGKVGIGGASGSQHNLVVKDPGLRARLRYDYHLLPGSPAIDAGLPLRPVNGVDLTPSREYVAPTGTKPRRMIGPPDAGAFEFEPGS